MSEFYVVRCKGPDWENIEAFSKADDARDYLAAELKFPGVTGQIKPFLWTDDPAQPVMK